MEQSITLFMFSTALTVGTTALSLFHRERINEQRKEREAINRFAEKAYDFCGNIAGWYTRIADISNSVLTSGRACSLDKARIDEYKKRILQIMTDDVYWTKIHASFSDLEKSLRDISHMRATEEELSRTFHKIEELSGTFDEFKSSMLDHKTFIHHLLEDWDKMKSRTQAEELIRLEIERVRVEDYKEKLAESIESLKKICQ